MGICEQIRLETYFIVFLVVASDCLGLPRAGDYFASDCLGLPRAGAGLENAHSRRNHISNYFLIVLNCFYVF